MSESLNYRLGLDASPYVSGMQRAQAEVRQLSSASRSSNLGALSGDLQMASGSLSTFTGGANSARGGLLELFNTAGSGSLGGVVAGFGGATTAVGVFASATAAAHAVLSNYAPFDSMVRGLKTLEGTAAATTARIELLRNVAQVPGLGFEEAVKADIRLRAVGFSAADSEAALRSFGNALATVGGGKSDLDGVVLGLSQIAAKGAISAEEINQIAERVPQVRAAMKAAFGTADSEALQKSGLSVLEFVRGLTAELAKLPQVTGGARNALDNYSDSWQALKTTTAEFGVQIASSWIKDVTRSFEMARRQVNWLKEAMGIKTPGLDGKDGKTEKEREAEKLAEAEAAAARKSAKAEIDASNATAQMREEKTQERIDALKLEADERVEIEKKADAEIKALRERNFATKMSPEENLKRRISEKEKEGPSDAAAFNAATSSVAKAAIYKRMTELLELRKQLSDLQNAAYEKANQEADAADRAADAAERKEAAEKKAAAAKAQAGAAFAGENAILEARLAGNDKLVKKLERQQAVEDAKLALMREQGLPADQAAAAAERRVALEEAVGKREQRGGRSYTLSPEESKARADARKAAVDEMRNKRWNEIGVAQKAAGAALEKPADKKDHSETVSKKLDRLAAIDEKLENIKSA